ncbi:hypothetical protein [Companilactobacillus mishanensis]|uniref:hypothetical protein n=1 Tax=Companilactobacillus mishanensis TaxID=2486008 RepID=UPI0012967A5A|nr:hypothetical protein [Companilactobacillus mishanensis]MQS88441.1 hypothetical protein [Companilactobacillus mishanensis]
MLVFLFSMFLAIVLLTVLLMIVKRNSFRVGICLGFVLTVGTAIYISTNASRIEFTSAWPFIEKVQKVQADDDDRKIQLSVSDFKEVQNDYDYVSYTELSENNKLYRGKYINQWGKIKDVIANDQVGRQLVIDLHEDEESSPVLVSYHLSDLAKETKNLKKGDLVNVYGEGSSSEGRLNQKRIPMIDAHFIEYENKGANS